MFELYVEQVRILEKMDLAGSISAFLHLVFVFNLRYPKVRIYSHQSHTPARSWSCSPIVPPRLCPVQTIIVHHNNLFQESETVCDFLQRAVANYGNEEGDRQHEFREEITKDYFRKQNQQGSFHCPVQVDQVLHAAGEDFGS